MTFQEAIKKFEKYYKDWEKEDHSDIATFIESSGDPFLPEDSLTPLTSVLKILYDFVNKEAKLIRSFPISIRCRGPFSKTDNPYLDKFARKFSDYVGSLHINHKKLRDDMQVAAWILARLPLHFKNNNFNTFYDAAYHLCNFTLSI